MKVALNVRKDFPLFERHDDLIYFDTAATAQKPKCVLETLQNFYSYHYGTVHRGLYTLSIEATEQFENARKKAQHFLHAAHPEEIVFTRSATASLNLIAHSFGSLLKPGDEILLTEIEHHSNLVPWQLLKERKGIGLRFIPVDDQGRIRLDQFHRLLNERVKLISLAHVSNVLGVIHPVEKIIERAHEMGAYVCLDGAQAAPHLPLDMQQLDADFYVFSGHKLYGPTGVGILYGKRELLEKMPPWEGGGSMIESVTLEKTRYQSPPHRFEAGTPMIAEAIALGSAIDYLQQIGIEAIRDYEKALLRYILSKFREMEEVYILGGGEHEGPLVSFNVEGIHASDLTTLLNCKNVALRSGHLCSQPTMSRFNLSSACRLSFGLYNTFEEIDRFFEILKKFI